MGTLMFFDELKKARLHISRFLASRPRLNRSDFAIRADIHRNTLYGDPDKWSWITCEKCLKAISRIESEEAKAQRKSRPSQLRSAA